MTFSTLTLNNFMDDISTLLNELSSYNSKPNITKTEQIVEAVPTEEELNNYILKRVSTLIDMNMEAIADIKPYVVQGCNPDEIASLAELFNSASKAVEVANKLNLQKKKFENDVKLKAIEHQFKKEIASIDTGPSTVNNNVFVASREEIFKRYIKADLEANREQQLQANEQIIITNQKEEE